MRTSVVNADFGASSFIGGTLTHVLNRTHSVRIISGRLITPDMPLGGVVSRLTPSLAFGSCQKAQHELKQ